MSYEFYKAALSIAPANQQEYWADGLQDLIDQQYANASTFYDIEEELTKGTLVFTDTTLRVSSAINSTTNEKLGDDFKAILFQSGDHVNGIGYRYRFDDNIWVTINTNNYKSVTTSVIVRRCNNSLNFYVDDVLVEEPCIIDYNISNNEFDFNKNIDLNDGDIFVAAQYNDTTKDIEINTRFMFGGQAFRVKSIDNLSRHKTLDNDSIYITKMVMKIDQVNTGNDDVDDNIAQNDIPMPWA